MLFSSTFSTRNEDCGRMRPPGKRLLCRSRAFWKPGEAMSSQLRIGVIGYGYWGPNLVRNVNRLADAAAVSVCDYHESRREHVRTQYPGMAALHDWREVVTDPAVDAVIIATPVTTHFELARAALQEGKHVLVEKPMAASLAEAEELLELSSARGLTLMVGHTFLYQGAIRRIAKMASGGELGELLYLDSTRANLGILQDDINVIWDLAPHDFSIMDHVVGEMPLSVSATGATHTDRRLEEIAFVTLHYRDDLIGHVNVNWLSPVKIRKILFGGTRKMVVYDDTEPGEKVKVYDRGVERRSEQDQRHNELIQYRAGDVFVPALDMTEPLFAEVKDFADSIRERRKPLADAESGIRVVRLLELACRSLAQGGVPLEVKP